MSVEQDFLAVFFLVPARLFARWRRKIYLSSEIKDPTGPVFSYVLREDHFSSLLNHSPLVLFTHNSVPSAGKKQINLYHERIRHDAARSFFKRASVQISTLALLFSAGNISLLFV